VEPSTQAVATTASPPSPVVASTTDVAAPASLPATTRRVTARPAPAAQSTRAAIDIVDAAWRARAVPALPHPAPLVAETSQPDPLSMPLLELKPLTAAPLELPALAHGASQR
jgi:hypothetical protein